MLIWTIVGAALLYVALLAIVLAFFAGAGRAKERKRRIEQMHRNHYTDEMNRTA
jgi:hypothetical protein